MYSVSSSCISIIRIGWKYQNWCQNRDSSYSRRSFQAKSGHSPWEQDGWTTWVSRCYTVWFTINTFVIFGGNFSALSNCDKCPVKDLRERTLKLSTDTTTKRLKNTKLAFSLNNKNFPCYCFFTWNIYFFLKMRFVWHGLEWSRKGLGRVKINKSRNAIFVNQMNYFKLNCSYIIDSLFKNWILSSCFVDLVLGRFKKF